MTFLPIVERELRVSARRPATHWVRFAVAGVVLLIWLTLALGAQRFAQPTELGRNLFNTLGVLGLAFCLFAGVFLTADCLSVERREGTLGLLFLTDLHGFDVVLGKLMTTSLQAAYALLAVLPMLALSVLLGGVSGGEFFRLVLVLLVTLFFTLSLGMAISAFSREASHAMLATFLLILALAGGLPTLAALLDVLGLVRYAGNPMNWLSPVYAYSQSFDNAYGFGKGGLHFPVSIATLFTVGLAALLLACRRLPRGGGDGESEVRRGHSESAARAGLRRPLTSEENPFAWLAARETRLRNIARATMLVLAVLWLACLGLTFASKSGVKDFGFTFCMFGAFVLHLLAKCFVAVEASRRFNHDRATGALELVLATPLTASQILDGQRSASIRFARLPVLVCMLVNLLLSWLLLGPDPINMGDERKYFLCLFIGGGIVLLLDVFALGWVGMASGLRHARQHRAVLVTLGKVLLAPWLGIFLFVFLSIAGTNLDERTGWGLVAAWFLFGGGISLAVGFKARSDLSNGFREMATGNVPAAASPPPDEVAA